MSENKRVTKAAGIVGIATLLSRIFGFARDMIIANFFGAGLGTDAFFVAFRIPNLMRRLFAEGSLSIAFIPVFTEYITLKGKDEAFTMARSAVRIMIITLFFISIIGIMCSPLIIKAIAPGFTDSYEKFQLTVTLTKIMFPYVFFICLVALCMGILNVLGHFAAPALAPVFLNISIIASVFIISPYLEKPILGLAIGVLIGGVVQLALQVPFLIKKRFYFWEKAPLFHPGLKKVASLMGPAIFGAAVYQLNILIGTLLASLLPEGSVSYLYFADRLVQFPLAIFAISVATAVLPSLARQTAEQDFNGVRDTFAFGMRFIFFITIPSMTGLIVLREPIIAILLQRGAFSYEKTKMCATALLYYGVGLWAFAGVRIVVSTFYALKDTKTPVRIAIISIIANIILGIILMQPMAHGGLALATSIASMINFILLSMALNKKIDSINWIEIISSAFKSLLCSIIMGIIVFYISILIIDINEKSLLFMLTNLITTISAGVIVYTSIAYLLKIPELVTIKNLIMKYVRKNKR